MAYEIFTRQVIRATSPRVTLNSRGRLVLNVAATKLLHDAGVDSVFLMWDSNGKKFALRSANKKDARAYSVKFSGKDGKWCAISAKSFLAHIGHDMDATKSYPATWDATQELLEVSLAADSEAVSTREPQRVRHMPRQNATAIKAGM